MTETTTVPSTASNGAGAAGSIEVENPATGQVIASVPIVAPEDVAALVARARRAQIGWDALGFDGRAAVMKRCQKWVSDNAERVIETIVSETGKAYEEALLAEIGYAEGAFAFWAKNAEKYLADERVKSASPFVKGRKLIVRYEPVGVVGVIGPWNYPLTNSFGDCIPALMAGNSVLLKPSEVTPLTSMLMGEMLRQCGLPEDVYQVVPGYGETGAGADRRGGLRDVHRLDRDRQEGDGARREDAHAGIARAGRQGPDDRLRRREPRAGRERGRPLLDAERRPDLHVDRAGVRRGADLRRVRPARDRPRAQAAPAGPRRGGVDRPRRGHQPAAVGHRGAAREGRRGARSAGARRRRQARRERATSSSPPCWWTSTTRWPACARRRSGRPCRS